MPKKTLKLESFDKGVWGNASPRNIPEDAMAYGENIDGSTPGVVKGIKDSTVVNAAFDARVFTSLLGDKNELIGQDSSKQFKSYNLNSDTTLAESLDSSETGVDVTDASNISIGDVVQVDSEQMDVTGISSNTLTVTRGYNGTAAASHSNGADVDVYTPIGSATSNFAKSLATINKQVYAGMTTTYRGDTVGAPKWVGRVSDPPFSTASSGDYVVEDAECKSFASDQDYEDDTSPLITLGDMPGAGGEAGIEGGSGSTFESTNDYYYAVSLIYDGYQESPLIFGEDNGTDKWKVTLGSDASYIDIVLRIGYDSGDFPPRITGINIYRATAPSGSEDVVSEYNLVKFIDDVSVGSTLDTDYKDMGIDLGSDISATDTSFEVTNSSMADKIMEGDEVKIDDEFKTVTSKSGTTINIGNAFADSHTTGTAVLIRYDYWSTGDTEGYPASYSPSNKFFYRFRDDGGLGASYEDNTGIPETLETTSVDFGISATYGGYLFMGQCSKDGVPDAERYIFRSKPRAFSLVDWTSDFLVLPERPRALAGFNGRLFAFGKSTMYRINPLSMDVEDTYYGVGAYDHNMVTATNFGMFHADESNIYINDGRTSKPIGNPILYMETSGLGYRELDFEQATHEHYSSMAFDPENKRLLVFMATGGTQTNCWAYDVVRKRWDYYKDFDIPSDTAVGSDGLLYATTGDTGSGFQTETLFTGSRKTWQLRTKDIDFGSTSGYTYLYDIHAIGKGDLDMGYFVNGGNVDPNPAVSTDESPGTKTVRKTTVESGDKKSRSIQIKVQANSGTDELYDITLQYRPMIINE